jgi:hypothetical protein
MNNRLLIAVLAALLGSASLQAENILVASSRSHSIEQFNTTGTWVRTFATTGPYQATSMAQSPLTGEIFVTTLWGDGPQVGQNSSVILRYDAKGNLDTNWDTFNFSCGFPCENSTESLLFDSSGNLWVATHFGKDLGQPIYIVEYLAANLTDLNPSPGTSITVNNMYRGDQMAFNASGNICIAGFIDEDVKCFDTSTGLSTADYFTEIQASGLGVEPGGLAFDAANRLYLTSIFTGQVVREVKPGGPIKLLATPATAPNQLEGNLVLRGGNLFTTSYVPAPQAPFGTPDAVYKISTSTGAVTPLVFGTAAPGLGNDHIWGAYWLMFHSEVSATALPPAE